MLNHLFHVGHEWRGHLQVHVAQGDIECAFDNAGIRLLADALKARRVPPCLVAAIIQECCFLRVLPTFFGINFDDLEVRWSRCIRQGGVEGPMGWNLVLSFILMLLVPCWNLKGYGINVSDDKHLCQETGFFTFCTHFTWSDNIYITASSRHQLKLMMDSLTRVLQSNGLKWKRRSLQFVSSTTDDWSEGEDKIVLEPFAADDGDEIKLWQRSDIKPVFYSEEIALERKDKMEILGSVVNFSGSNDDAVFGMLAKAQNAFWGLKSMFFDSLLSEGEVSEILPAHCSRCTALCWILDLVPVSGTTTLEVRK